MQWEAWDSVCLAVGKDICKGIVNVVMHLLVL
jgi:hypothetical protein